MDQQDSHDDSSFLAELEARVRARAARDHQRLVHEQFVRDVEAGYRSTCMANFGTWPPTEVSHVRQLHRQPDMTLFSRPDLFNLHSEDSFSSQGDLSITQSLLSPGQFGSPSDWSPQQHQSHATHGTMRDAVVTSYDQTESIEFTPHLPPSSFPGFPGPIARPTRQSAQPQPRGYAPQSLLQMQMYGGAHGSTMLMTTGQMMDTSTGFVSRPVRWTEPPNAYIHSLPAYVRNQSLQGQNDPPARRRNSSNSSSNDSSSFGSSRGSSSTSTNCSYCHSVGKPSAGHNKYNCHVLAELPPCRTCEASGKYNHTASHCPAMKKQQLVFIPKDKRRRPFNPF